MNQTGKRTVVECEIRDVEVCYHWDMSLFIVIILAIIQGLAGE
jgi:hypothetical protein